MLVFSPLSDPHLPLVLLSWLVMGLVFMSPPVSSALGPFRLSNVLVASDGLQSSFHSPIHS
jgi:hypothetical protein